ncbi:MAG: response regulator [Verrucomicrobiota bacterium]
MTEENKKNILIVDDEQSSLDYLKACLKKGGFTCSEAKSVTEAKEILETQGFSAFDCLITDYYIPDHNGIELLNWVQSCDNTLAVSIITAEGEKELVTESLRKGAADYMEKPVRPNLLNDSVKRLCQLTARRRELSESKRAVSELAQLQNLFCQSKPIPGIHPMEFIMIPMHELGGDFLDIVQLSDKRYIISCADVSGHNLKAAYVSAYFQGMSSGMLLEGASTLETIHKINQIMVNDWNDPKVKGTHRPMFSIAAIYVVLDLEQQNIEIYNCGFPGPALLDVDSLSTTLDVASQPLGWFKDGLFTSHKTDLNNLTHILLYTDGLLSLAEALEVHPYALGFRLLKAENMDERLSLTYAAHDDILLIKIYLTDTSVHKNSIFYQKYSRTDINDIDMLQTHWEKSLLYALGDKILESRIDDILVSTREIVLNSLEHGCQKSSESYSSLDIIYDEDTEQIIIQVNDEGTGFEFNIEQRLADMEKLDAISDHIGLGLTLVHGLVDKLEFSENSSAVKMTFNLEKKL